MKVLHVVGTRPNFMKIDPLMRALRADPEIEQSLVHTGQHYDRPLSDAFFADLDLPDPDHFLGVGSGSHGEQTARTILALEPILVDEAPDVVVVPGDVNSTLAAALASVKLGIRVVHAEAGLRSGDRAMPEEHNRVLTDHMADLLLTPSRDADANLRAEGIPEERIAFVGNLMIDSLLAHVDAARELAVARDELGFDDYILLTLHRPTLVDDETKLRETWETLERIAATRPVFFPVHPRTAKRIAAFGLQASAVQLLEPQSYLRFLSLMASAAAVVTDSGGIQEEATVLGIPCFTLRTTTERPITVDEGTNTLLGIGREALAQLESELVELRPATPHRPEGWDGAAGARAAAAVRALCASAVER